MNEFPRTEVGGISVSRMIIGTNWFLGWSHTSAARDKLIGSTQTPSKVADIIEVYLKAGVDTIMGFAQRDVQHQAVQEAQQRTGKKMIVISTPAVPVDDNQASRDEAQKIFDAEVQRNVDICLPHSSSIDRLVDRRLRKVLLMDEYSKMIRDRGMKPGMSTHTNEAPIYADESGLDVDTYIQIYNAAGFLMPLEVDWVQRIIWGLKKPVMTIKPMASGRLHPLVGLAFSWATLRDQDMVTVGTLTPDEAQECIDISMSVLSRQANSVKLQRTRSKSTVDGK